MIFKTCPYCGANLDPEEICDCKFAQRDYDVRRLQDEASQRKSFCNIKGGYKYNDGSMKNIYRLDMSSLLDPAPGLEKVEYFGPGNKEHWNL